MSLQDYLGKVIRVQSVCRMPGSQNNKKNLSMKTSLTKRSFSFKRKKTGQKRIENSLTRQHYTKPICIEKTEIPPQDKQYI